MAGRAVQQNRAQGIVFQAPQVATQSANMLEYPTVDKQIRREQVYVFDKLDGSNIRAEWNKKKGLWKFGRRHGLLDASTPVLLKAPEIIKQKYTDIVAEALKKERVVNAVLFFEFYGEHSSFGNHVIDDDHNVMLIDASIDMKEMIEPREFCRVFQHVPHATMLAHQVFSSELEQQVRNGSLWGDNKFHEGVVCKSKSARFKVKTDMWLEKLRSHCGNNEKLYKELE